MCEVHSSELSAAYEFQPVAVESHGPLSEATACFSVSKISERLGEPLETQVPLPMNQRVNQTLQLNPVSPNICRRGGHGHVVIPDCCKHFVFNPGLFTTGAI